MNLISIIHNNRGLKLILYGNIFIFSAYAYTKVCEKEREMYISEKEKQEPEFPDGCCLEQNQYRLLSYTSCIPAFVSIYGFKRGYWDLASLSLGGAITSVLYWTKPDYSWRRTLDVNFIRAAMLYHCLRGYNAEKGKYLYTYYALVCILYTYEINFLYLKKRYWLFTYSHILLHLIGNTGNALLYNGSIPKLPLSF